MRFPLALTLKIAKHITKNRLKGTSKFAMVLQLEPLSYLQSHVHGVRTHPGVFHQFEGFGSARAVSRSGGECDAPMVSVCGGEP